MWHEKHIFKSEFPAFSTLEPDSPNTNGRDRASIHATDSTMGNRCQVDEIRAYRGTVTCAARVDAIGGLCVCGRECLLASWLGDLAFVSVSYGHHLFIPDSRPTLCRVIAAFTCIYAGI